MGAGYKVRLGVADVNRGATVEEERYDGRVHNGALTLVGCLGGDTGKVDRLTAFMPVHAGLQGVKSRAE